jgi:hypothetical protein
MSMKRKINITKIFFLVLLFSLNMIAQQDWTHKVRIAGHPLSNNNVDQIIKSASESFVYGIEVDNDITGRYDSFLNPEEKLKAIREVTEKAHKINNKVFVYIAGLECITSEADDKENTFFKDHPDWVQRDINGRPAIFGGDDAFWITEGDEDVWISPYAVEWRKIYMQRVREIAETGIDGIYVDIPYWMTHFEGWVDTWASFDDYTVAVFKEQTGLNAKEDIQLGNYDDPGFIKWINFRINTLTDFMEEIDRNVKEVNPECKTIAEIYPGIGEEVIRVGSDVYKMYEAVDVIAHEYSEGEYYASDRAPLDWYNYIIGMHTFRAFAEDKASWMLSYSWFDNEKVNPSDAMKSLFVSQLFSGTNMWDVRGYVMSGTNDMETRKTVYKWVSKYEDKFYTSRVPLQPVGVYFSDNTRNYFSEEFISSYCGILNLLIHSHIQFQIVTPRTLEELSPSVLILPGVKCLSDDEINTIKSLKEKGMKFIITGETGKYNENREVRKENVLEEIFAFQNNVQETKGKNYIYVQNCPGNNYSQIINSDLNSYFLENRESNKIEKAGKEFLSVLHDLTYSPKLKIDAPIDIIATSSITDENIYLYLTNVKGICESCNSSDRSIKNVKIVYDESLGSGDITLLPFLGKETKLEVVHSSKEFSFTVPEIKRGMLVTIKR